MAVTTIPTKYGDVYRYVGGCKDDYDNIVTSSYYRRYGVIFKKRPVAITIQRPALKALRAAEKRLGRQIVVTGSARSCEYQAELYRKDPSRYAAPSVGVHCQALAFDVTTADPELKTKVRAALYAEGFHQSRPDDEPWHFSYAVTA
jgi:hypothetical protein